MSEATELANDAGTQNLGAYANALLEDALAGPREQLGERLFRMFLTTWENPQLRPQLLEKVRSATTSDTGAVQLRDHFTSMLVARVGEVAKVPQLNLNAMVVQIMGVIMLRYVLMMEPIVSASPDELVATFAPTIQRYLDA